MSLNSILHNIKHFILRKESKISSSSDEEIPTYALTTATHDEVKVYANEIMDYLIDCIDAIQPRLDDANVAYDYMGNDDELRLKYGSNLGSHFGQINVLTKIADKITNNLSDVIDGNYDHLPANTVGGMVISWDHMLYDVIEDVNLNISTIENYIKTLDGSEFEAIQLASKPATIH